MTSNVFRLTSTELNRAKAALRHHGYSTMLPDPIEWEDLEDQWDAVRSDLSRLDLEHYRPNPPVVVTAAKNEKSTRAIYLLHPHDILIYTSLTLLLKDDIEASRVPGTQKRVYSYRASCLKDNLYRTARNSHADYVKRLREKSKRIKTHFVGVTDIADFYSSLSQEVLCRLLLDAARTKRSKEAAKLIISTFASQIMLHPGKGIPTGPYASRILAEALLDNIDRYLMQAGVDFVRWVDDYNLFGSSFEGVQRAILELSGWLYREHGLTLQLKKTHIYDVDTYSDGVLRDPEEQLKEVDVLPVIGDYQEDDSDYVMEDSETIALLETLAGDIWREDAVNYRRIRFVARRLRRRSLDGPVADDLLDILIENYSRLWPAAEEVGRLIGDLLPRVPHTREHTRRLLRAVAQAGTVDHQAVWILAVFARHAECWGRADELAAIASRSDSDAIMYYAMLAIAHTGRGDRPYKLGLTTERWRGRTA